jgi:putative flippase GtrA
MQKYIAKKRIPQFILFLLAGGIAAGANFGSRFLFSLFVGYKSAIVIAYGVGMIAAFLLMRGHVFEAQDKVLAPQLWKFAGINMLAILQTLIISVVLASYIFPAFGVVKNAEAYAHLVGVLVPAVTSYFGHKLWSFR